MPRPRKHSPGPQMSLVAYSFVLPLCRCLFSVYLTARQIMMTFVSLINPAIQNKTVDFFITVSTSSTQHCAQRIVGDQQMFSGGKAGERGGKEAIIWDANGLGGGGKPSYMLVFGLWSKKRMFCPQPVAPKQLLKKNLFRKPARPGLG